MTKQEKAVLAAAKAWWKGRRPADWDLNQHLSNPSADTIGDKERRLARAVSRPVYAQTYAKAGT